MVMLYQVYLTNEQKNEKNSVPGQGNPESGKLYTKCEKDCNYGENIYPVS